MTTPADAVRAIAAAAADDDRRVFLPMGAAEPVALREAWRADPDSAAGLAFTGVFLPGVNGFDYTTLHPSARLNLHLLTAELAPAVRAGRASLWPISYTQTFAAFARTRFAAIVAHLAAPGADGRCSLGLSADFTPAALAAPSRLKVALVNHAMPAVADAPSVGLEEFDLVVEGDWPLVEGTPPKPVPAEAIAHAIADRVPDGATIQIGVGRLPGAILASFAGKRGLKMHGGLLSDAHLALLDAGAIADEPGALTAGAVLGGAALYARIARDPRVRLRPVSYTHGLSTLAGIDRFFAVNAALEADLYGQVNAEFAGADAIASVGGLADFVRGAQASPGGAALLAIQAEGRDGTSRIVPRLPGPVTLARAEAPTLVTEHGTADLAVLDVERRASAMIALAAPGAREALRNAWRSA